MLFAPIKSRPPSDRYHAVTIHLAPAPWLAPYDPNSPTGPDAVYRFSFPTETWRDRHRKRSRQEMIEAIVDQRRDHGDGDETWHTYLFFLDLQDGHDPVLIDVEDHRLACFFRPHKCVYLNL